MSYSREATGLNLAAMAPRRELSGLRTAPNLLTLTRILLLPILILAVLDRNFSAAFLMFLVAALTDAMDGLLARWLRQRSRLGQYLDPIADKILLSSLFLVLTRMGILETRVAAIVFGRDIGMLCVASILYSITDLRDFRPTLLGKANSLSQMVAIGFVLLSLASLSSAPWVFAARRYSLDAAMLLTVLSGFHYALVASQRIGPVTEAAGPRQIRRLPLV